MSEWKEIVIVVEVDPDRLAEFPVAIRGTLDAWADLGLIGNVAAWSVYATVPQAALFEL